MLSPQKIVKNFVVLNFFFSRLSQKFQSVTAYLMQHEPPKKKEKKKKKKGSV